MTSNQRTTSSQPTLLLDSGLPNNGMHPTPISVDVTMNLDGFEVMYAAGDAGRQAFPR